MLLPVLLKAVLCGAAIVAYWLACSLPVAFAADFQAVAATFALLSKASASTQPTNRPVTL